MGKIKQAKREIVMERKRHKYDSRRVLSVVWTGLLSILSLVAVFFLFERTDLALQRFCKEIDGGTLGICLGGGSSVVLAGVISWIICRYWWRPTFAQIYFWCIQYGFINSFFPRMEIRYALIFFLPQTAVWAYCSWRNKRSVRDGVFSASGQATDDAAAASGLGAIDVDSTSF